MVHIILCFNIHYSFTKATVSHLYTLLDLGNSCSCKLWHSWVLHADLSLHPPSLLFLHQTSVLYTTIYWSHEKDESAMWPIFIKTALVDGLMICLSRNFLFFFVLCTHNFEMTMAPLIKNYMVIFWIAFVIATGRRDGSLSGILFFVLHYHKHGGIIRLHFCS